VEKREVLMDEAIHSIGEFEVNIRTHTDVVQPVLVVVEAA
jgi:ribosomal protein L9